MKHCHHLEGVTNFFFLEVWTFYSFRFRHVFSAKTSPNFGGEERKFVRRCCGFQRKTSVVFRREMDPPRLRSTRIILRANRRGRERTKDERAKRKDRGEPVKIERESSEHNPKSRNRRRCLFFLDPGPGLQEPAPPSPSVIDRPRV